MAVGMSAASRDLAIVGLSVAVATAGVLLLVGSGDDEPSAVEKVELAARELPNVRDASCRSTADHRFRCRVIRRDRRIDICRAGTDADGRLSSLECRPAPAR